MKRKMATAAVILACASFGAHAVGYDLDSYVKLVESRNRDLELARQDIAAAEQERREALAALLPGVGIHGGYTRNLKDITQPEAIYAVGPVNGIYPFVYQDVVTSYDNTFSIAGGVSLPVFAPQSVTAYRQAEEGLHLRQSAYEYQRRVIVNAASKLYYQTLLLEEVVKVKEASERSAHENYQNIEAKFEAGVATELDKLMAEVDWKSKTPELAEAQRNFSLALMNLKSLAGIGADEDVGLTEGLDKYPELPAELGLDDALASRLDYKLLLQQRQLGDLAVKKAMAAYLPTVDASFTAAYQDMSGNSAGAEDYKPFALQLGLTVNLPVYEGGYRAAKLAAEKIGGEKIEIALAKKREDVKTELASLRLRLTEARERIDSSSALVDAAQKAFSQADLSLKSGMVTQIQLTQASLNLEGSRLQYYSAVYEYLAACFDWELAAGG